MDCGPPVPPKNGLIFPYTSTLKEASVQFTCQTENVTSTRATVCNQMGIWEPNPAHVCESGTHTVYYALFA